MHCETKKMCSDYCTLYRWHMIHPVVLVIEQIPFMLNYSRTFSPLFSSMHSNIHEIKCEFSLILSNLYSCLKLLYIQVEI